MSQVKLKEFRIKLPGDIISMVNRAEILNMQINKAINKVEYYRTRCSEMGKKYGMDFDAFQKKINGEENEVCSEWDDLILWEGYHYAYKEWKTNYEELEPC